MQRSIQDRFFMKVPERPDGQCWNWIGARKGKGQDEYGALFGLPGQPRVTILAHRLSWELHVGPIPDGLTIDHLCRNKRCVNPAHLEPVTQAVNTRRWADTITHCPAGHAYDASNTYVNPGRKKRACRTCQAERMLKKSHAVRTNRGDVFVGRRDPLFWRQADASWHCFTWSDVRNTYSSLCSQGLVRDAVQSQACLRPRVEDRCAECDRAEMQRRGWSAPGPARPALGVVR